jgi:hypothetical protein
MYPITSGILLQLNTLQQQTLHGLLINHTTGSIGNGRDGHLWIRLITQLTIQWIIENT